MRYVMVKWYHNFIDQPIETFSEIDDDRWEVRKLEIYPDKSFGFANEHVEFNGSFLAEAPYPTIDEINMDKQFNAKEISKAEFENKWNIAFDSYAQL